ncbi:hypothetical protein DFJ74DRAFT_663888 [Hyaloraphidium curvatum]|nr:hypothetical protein DFJ74DRAFT_663888 [Hyaloraphidium curvatum]
MSSGMRDPAGWSVTSKARALERINTLITAAEERGGATLDSRFLSSLMTAVKKDGSPLSPMSVLTYHAHAVQLSRHLVAIDRGIAPERAYKDVPANDNAVQDYRRTIGERPVRRIWDTVKSITQSKATRLTYAAALLRIFVMMRRTAEHPDPAFFDAQVKKLGEYTRQAADLQLPQQTEGDLNLRVDFVDVRRKVESFAESVLRRFETESRDVAQAAWRDI